MGNGQGGRSATTAQEHAFPKRVSSERARRAGGKNGRYVRTAPWRAKRRQKFVQYQCNILIRIHDRCASFNNFPFLNTRGTVKEIALEIIEGDTFLHCTAECGMAGAQPEIPDQKASRTPLVLTDSVRHTVANRVKVVQNIIRAQL